MGLLDLAKKGARQAILTISTSAKNLIKSKFKTNFFDEEIDKLAQQATISAENIIDENEEKIEQAAKETVKKVLSKNTSKKSKS